MALLANLTIRTKLLLAGLPLALMVVLGDHCATIG
jgi:hypothetical protein